jgi:hypothetical protein
MFQPETPAGVHAVHMDQTAFLNNCYDAVYRDGDIAIARWFPLGAVTPAMLGNLISVTYRLLAPSAPRLVSAEPRSIVGFGDNLECEALLQADGSVRVVVVRVRDNHLVFEAHLPGSVVH